MTDELEYPNRPYQRKGLSPQLNGQSLVIEEVQNQNEFKLYSWKSLANFTTFIMNKSTKTGLIGIALLVALMIVIFLINLQYSSLEFVNTKCLKLEGEATCHSLNKNPYRYYGTKTAYHVVLDNNTDLLYGDCDPQLFYLFTRHATRYPDKEEIEEMAMRLPMLKEKILTSCNNNKCKLCEEDIEKLKSWRLKIVPENDNQITKTGEQEAADLAQRFKNKFPTLLDRSYSLDAFTFEYTSRLRTFQTAEAFAKGLFGAKRKEAIDLSGNTNDPVLQFHKNCKVFQKNCNYENLDLSELKQFEEGPVLKLMTGSISERLGFDLNFTDVKLMHRACSFGYALNEDDIWCSIFSNSDLKVFNFDDDIDDYYKDGYGNVINYEQACPVVKHLVETLKDVASNNRHKAVLLFSHAGAIKKVYARFGLFKDVNHISANGICFSSNREWKSSFIAPFNTNIAFVLFQCGRDHKIAAFHNEKPIVIGGCKDLLCPIETFYKTYNPIANDCDLKSTCCSCCTT